MCQYLTKNIKKYKKAKSDITCFKLLLDNNGKFLTFYQLSEVDLKEGQKIENFSNSSIKEIDNYLFKGLYFKRIDDGAIHSFCDYFEVFKEVLSRRNIYASRMVVMECVIPKDAFYIEGVDFSSNKTYCSSELKYIKEIKC